MTRIRSPEDRESVQPVSRKDQVHTLFLLLLETIITRPQAQYMLCSLRAIMVPFDDLYCVVVSADAA